MNKTGKVKSIARWDTPKDEWGNYTFTVEFESGDVGYRRSKDEEDKYFLIGQEVEYDIEEKEKKDGSGTYFTIKKPKKDFNPGGGGNWKPKDAVAYKSEAITMCLKYAYEAVSLLEAEKTPAKIAGYFKAFIKLAHEEIDKLHSV